MTKIKTVIVISLLALSIIACQGTDGLKPPRSLSPNLEQSQAMEKALKNPDINPTTGKLTIRLNELQVTSYLNFKLGKEMAEYLSNPQIIFEPGQFHIYGTLKGLVFHVDGKIIGEVSLVNNVPQVNIVSVDFGVLPVPAVLLSSLADQINKVITRDFAQSNQNYQIQSVAFTTGWATIELIRK